MAIAIKLPRGRPSQKLNVPPRPRQLLIFEDDGWQKIEDAYRRPLPVNVRVLINLVTLVMQVGAASEIESPPLKPTLSKIRAVRTSADSLRKVLSSSSSKALPSSREALERQLLNELKIVIELQGNDLTFLRTLLDAAVASCDLVLDKINQTDYSPLTIGESWNWWIIFLSVIMKVNGLPYEVRKDSDKQVERVHSPFVHFVKELESQLGLKHFVTEDGLDHAIGRARKKLRLKVKFESEMGSELEEFFFQTLGGVKDSTGWQFHDKIMGSIVEQAIRAAG